MHAVAGLRVPGLDPGIHAEEKPLSRVMLGLSMGHRVKPGGDERKYASPASAAMERGYAHC
jgi:hypothetical protein